MNVVDYYKTWVELLRTETGKETIPNHYLLIHYVLQSFVSENQYINTPNEVKKIIVMKMFFIFLKILKLIKKRKLCAVYTKLYMYEPNM